MNKKNIFVISIFIIFIVVSIFISLDTFNGVEYNNKSNKVLLSSNELGNVSVEGPYGNISSPIKIAFIVGVHPLESNSHNTLLNLMKTRNNSLKYRYYVYIINVTKNKTDFDKGRLNGQLLAKNYVVPSVIKNNFTFVVDIHSHRGVYVSDNFLIAPLNNNKSKEIANNLIEGISGMDILEFKPATDGRPTSPDYVTIPIINNGTSAIIYETYINESFDITNSYLSKFIDNLDNFNFHC